MDRLEHITIHLAQLMRGVNKDREEENNVSRDLPRGKLNPIYIPKNSYRHHVYMDNGVYDK